MSGVSWVNAPTETLDAYADLFDDDLEAVAVGLNRLREERLSDRTMKF